jgi:hypothetical protein
MKTKRGREFNEMHQTNLLSDCRVDLNGALTGTKLLVEFTLTAQSNNLSKLQSLSKRQITIHKLISYLKYEKGMSWKRISSWLNRSGIKTHRGNTWTETGSSVHSVIKRMRQREDRINNQRNKKHETTMTDFKIKKIGE